MKTIDEFISEAKIALEKKGVNLKVLEGGTERGVSTLRNRQILDLIAIKMHLVSDCEFEATTETTFLGKKIALPVMPAPLSGLVKAVDENCFRRIVEESWMMGVVPWLGYPIQQDVREFEKEFVWIIKPLSDRKKILNEIEKAERSKALAIGVDIDSSAGVKIGGSILDYGGTKNFTKKELKDLVSTTKLPFIAKGVLSEVDYYKLADFCSAVVLSNHGGRVMDSAASPLEILRKIEKITVTGIDSGFRYGTDVFKALALGADFVLVGRLIVYALAVENGIYKVLEILKEELKRIMQLTCSKSVKEISRELIIF
ncbi:MAG: alpha-hydroxy acid oxidase [Archaeoglobales archaeon]|nr:alpha-hydroxy acid oxidase [Archaeoglobales archaeon]